MDTFTNDDLYTIMDIINFARNHDVYGKLDEASMDDINLKCCIELQARIDAQPEESI